MASKITAAPVTPMYVYLCTLAVQFYKSASIYYFHLQAKALSLRQQAILYKYLYASIEKDNSQVLEVYTIYAFVYRHAATVFILAGQLIERSTYF